MLQTRILILFYFKFSYVSCKNYDLNCFVCLHFYHINVLRLGILNTFSPLLFAGELVDYLTICFMHIFCLAAQIYFFAEDKSKRAMKPKPIALPVDTKVPRERKYSLCLCNDRFMRTFSVIYIFCCP